MTRNLDYKVEAADDGKSIGAFLKEKSYSRAVVIALKKTPTGIRKNGVWAGVNEILHTGDLLEICLREEVQSDNIVPTQGLLEILYEDQDVLILNKPYDTPIHPSINNYENTLANTVMYYYGEQEKRHTFRCINRLDRDTTGVTLIAKNLLSASILGNRMVEHGLSRTYIAFVEGVTEAGGIIDLPIGRAEGTIIKRQVDRVNGQCAKTHYRRLEVLEIEGVPVSVVALRLETGRTHQIRVHMAAIGHPLLGDFLYNENNHMLTRQALHGIACGFAHPITGEVMHMIAPLPADMAALYQRGRSCECAHTDLEKRLHTIQW